MRPRRRLLRSLVALVALTGFFTAGVSEARAVQPCPHHDALPGMDMGAHHTSSAAAADPHAHHASQDKSSSKDEAGHGPCSCIVCFDAGTHLHQVVVPSAVVVAFEVAPTVFTPSVRVQVSPVHTAAVRWRPDLPNAPPFLA